MSGPKDSHLERADPPLCAAGVRVWAPGALAVPPTKACQRTLGREQAGLTVAELGAIIASPRRRSGLFDKGLYAIASLSRQRVHRCAGFAVPGLARTVTTAEAAPASLI